MLKEMSIELILGILLRHPMAAKVIKVAEKGEEPKLIRLGENVA